VTELTVQGLHKAYGSNPVLTGLDLTVPAGSLTAILGPSGSGKTTLLRLLAGFDQADAGTVQIGGTIVDGPGGHVPPERRRIGYVPQEGSLFPHLTVAANVGFGLPARERRGPRVAGLLEAVGLAGLGKRYPHQLSGGQQQRVALARALAIEPALVLLDEPFASLDAHLRASVRADVQAIFRAAGTTAILVTHDQDEALSMADRVAVLRGGQIAQCAAPQDLYIRPADPQLARFIGEANLLDGELEPGSLPGSPASGPAAGAGAAAAGSLTSSHVLAPDRPGGPAGQLSSGGAPAGGDRAGGAGGSSGANSAGATGGSSGVGATGVADGAGGSSGAGATGGANGAGAVGGAGDRAGPGMVRTIFGPLPLAAASAGPELTPGPVTVLIRPEQLEIRLASPANGSRPAGEAASDLPGDGAGTLPGEAVGGLPGRVLACEYYGHDAVLRVRASGSGQASSAESGAAGSDTGTDGVTELIIRTSGGPQLPPGADVLVSARGPVLAWPAAR
jgi:iron(III) transport system ATP-binding protein